MDDAFQIDKEATARLHGSFALMRELRRRADGSLSRLLAHDVLGVSDDLLDELGWPRYEVPDGV